MVVVLAALGEAATSATVAAQESRPTESFRNGLIATPHLGWEFAGPTTYVSAFAAEGVEKKKKKNNNNNTNDNGDSSSENEAPPLAAAGAVQNLVQQWDGAPWFLGSVNGGVWKTDSLPTERTTSTSTSSTHWTNVLDGHRGVACASISALHASPLRANRIYAGCGGSTSSEQGRDWNVVNSGEWGGVMVSDDNGDSWKMLEGFPPNYYVTDILETVGTNTDNNNDDDDRPILLVSAQSHLFDRDDGGIWRSVDGGKTFARVHDTPTFGLYRLDPESHPGTLLATHARSASHSLAVSTDSGATFSDPAWDPLPWKPGAVPFYTCATVLGNGDLVVAGLSRFAGLPNNTDSQFFVKESSGNNSWTPLEQPMAMDQDGMPKDRMAVLADPLYRDLLYVAGNAGALAWRVNTTTKHWEELWGGGEVADGSVPHGDCRNFAWDFENDRLLLVTDGGVFARSQPRAPGGRWTSLNGDYASLELLSARYDPKDGRFVMGAQDNCAIVTKPNAGPSDPGYCFVQGDGAITFVDSAATPSRLFGTTQFLGVGTVERDPATTRSTKPDTNNNDNDNDDDDNDNDDDEDEGCGGLCFAQGDNFVEVPVADYFVESSTFPFFVHPYTLNVQDPTKLHFWTNGTVDRPSAIYEFRIPYSVRGKDDIPPPTKLLETPEGVYILDFVSGGYTAVAPGTAGEPDPGLLVAISNQHLYVRSKADRGHTGGFVARPLPVEFALPIGLEYDRDGQRILGPLTHARTVSMAVSAHDSNAVAVTGWQSIRDNNGDESVFVTLDAGKSWRNITGNLRAASGVAGTLRPGGLCWIDVWDERGYGILLVGTSTGIVATVVEGVHNGGTGNAPEHHHHQRWMRLGTREEFPLVLVADIDYEPTSDTLVAATFGRGVYILRNAKKLLGSDLQGCLSMSPKRAFCGECTHAFQEGTRHDRRVECCCVAAEEEPRQRLRATVG